MLRVFINYGFKSSTGYSYSLWHAISYLFYLLARNYPWVLKNKRPEKLQDTLKELEVFFRKINN